MTELDSTPPLYATFPRRLLALVVDGLVSLSVLAVAVLLGANLPLGPKARAALLIACVLFPLLYEPCSSRGRSTVATPVFNLKVVPRTPPPGC